MQKLLVDVMVFYGLLITVTYYHLIFYNIFFSLKGKFTDFQPALYCYNVDCISK